MKKYYSLLLLLTIMVVSVHAQHLICMPSDSAEITANVTDEFDPNDIHLHLRNTTSGPVTVTWGMVNYTAPVGWEIKLCDNNNCYDLLIHAGPYVSNTILAGDTMDFKFQY